MKTGIVFINNYCTYPTALGKYQNNLHAIVVFIFYILICTYHYFNLMKNLSFTRVNSLAKIKLFQCYVFMVTQNLIFLQNHPVVIRCTHYM